MPSRSFEFVQVDVFTNRPLEGNQLAVFTDARGLTDQEMQRLAKEMNLSETTFILPRDQAAEDSKGVRVRIFTVQEELQFAGHPTLGTAWCLKQQRPGEDTICLDLNVGKVPVRFEQRGEDLFGEMRQADPKFGEFHQHSAVARVLGVRTEELDESLPIQTVSTGMAFTIVPFRDVSTLAQLQIGWTQLAPYLQGIGGGRPAFFYFVARHADRRGQLCARMIFYNGEDPATGSAAGCCAAWAVKHGVLASDEQGVIEQGRDVLRPSYLFVRATRQGEEVVNVRVGGHVVRVIDGLVKL